MVVWAQADSYKAGSNMKAEAKAFGKKGVMIKIYKKNDIETDSKMVVMLLHRDTWP